MNVFYPWLATVATLTLALASPSPQEHPLRQPAPAANGEESPGALFSQKALRRARLLIQMRMLELRAERLECVRESIIRRLPPDLRPPSRGESANAVKQSSANDATRPRSAISKSEDCEWLSIQPPRRRRMV
jgi:hypothetical protein